MFDDAEEKMSRRRVARVIAQGAAGLLLAQMASGVERRWTVAGRRAAAANG
jgi:hypothetical protein